MPRYRRGVWRRGAVTFRLPEGTDPPDDFFPDLVFARTLIRSLGQVRAADLSDRTSAAVRLAGGGGWRNVHVWHRGPGEAATADRARAALLAACGLPAETPLCAEPGDLVLDCMIDDPDRWWIGWHRAGTPPSRWPGGIYPIVVPADKVSRAWLKLDEAIATFGIPFAPGQRACELGAAPGGSCQRLLEAGLQVVGIDPAVIDDRVAGHPRFEHWRRRSRDVRLREFRGFDWVVSDMNIDPSSTIEALARIVVEAGTRPRGIVATLKLPAWSRAEALPRWLATFRGWGYEPHVRHLASGGRELCCFATRPSRAVSRRPAKRRRDR